jgi:hypothetical protein
VVDGIHPDGQPSLLAICDRYEIERLLHMACKMLLPPPNKYHRRPIIEPGSIPQQPECSWPIHERPILGAQVVQEIPLQSQVQPVEIVACSIEY